MHVVKVEFDMCSHNAGVTPTGLVYGCCLPITLTVTIELLYLAQAVTTYQRLHNDCDTNPTWAHSESLVLYLHVTSSCVIYLPNTSQINYNIFFSFGESQVTLEQSMPVM